MAIGQIVYLPITDASGNMMLGGSVTTYEAGTTTNQIVYTDGALTTPAANPVVDNQGSSGVVSFYIDPQLSYKLVFNNSLGTPVRTVDNWSIRSPNFYSQMLSVSSNTTVTYSQVGSFIRGNAGSGSITITLPTISSVPIGWSVSFYRADSSGNTITIARAGSDLFSDSSTSKLLTAPYISGSVINNGSTWDFIFPTGTVTDASIAVSNITTNNVTTSAHGFCPIAPNSTTQYLRGDATWASIPNVTISAAGLVPTAPNSTTQFLRGDATWQTPPAATIPTGQCLLQVTNSTTLTLIPLNGNSLGINGGVSIIPSAGVTLANTGLTAATLYYIYAYMNGGTMTLEASTTAYVTNSTTGITQKSGDATRTLVGMVYMDAGTPGTFVDSVTKRYLANWFNRTTKIGVNSFTSATTNIASGAMVESSTTIRVNFITWATSPVHLFMSGVASLAANAGEAVSAAIWVDGAVVSSSTGITQAQSPVSATNNYPLNTSTATQSLSEGFHYATLAAGKSTTGISSWVFNAGSNSTSLSLYLVL